MSHSNVSNALSFSFNPTMSKIILITWSYSIVNIKSIFVCHHHSFQNSILSDLRILCLSNHLNALLSFDTRLLYCIFKKCTCSGSNRGPLACEANVITNYTTGAIQYSLSFTILIPLRCLDNTQLIRYFDNMLEAIILAALGIFFIWSYYSLFLKPQGMMRKYKQAFEAEGYKVEMLPYKLLGNTKSQINNRDQKKYDDPYYRFKGENQRYDVTIYNIFNWPAIDIGRPELLKEFYQPANAHYYEKVKSFVSNLKRIIGGGILLSEGEIWKDKRKVMNKIFNYDFITDNIPKIERIIDQALDKLEERETKGDGSKQVIEADLLSSFSLMYANVVVETFLGCESSKLQVSGQPLPWFIDRLNRDGVKQYSNLPGIIFGANIFNLGITNFDRDINQRKAIMEGIVRDQIKRRITEIQSSDQKDEKITDIIQALYKMEKQNTEGKKYTESDICEEFLIFYQAGTDTTAHLMTMMVYYIAMNPDVEQKLRKCIDEVIHSEEDFTLENLKKLKYIEWIQNQTTRMYGPATGLLPRTTVQDHYLGNVPIRKGTCLSLMIMGIHYSPEFYKEPNCFRPERWQNQCSSNAPYTLNGFSGGPRNCIGKHLALLQTKITLIKMMRRYKSLKLPKIPKMQMKAIYEPEPLKIKLQKTN